MESVEPRQHKLTTATLRVAVIAGAVLPVAAALSKHDLFFLVYGAFLPALLYNLAARALRGAGVHVDGRDTPRPGEQLELDLPETYPSSFDWTAVALCGALIGGFVGVVVTQTCISVASPFVMYGISVVMFIGTALLAFLGIRVVRRVAHAPKEFRP